MSQYWKVHIISGVYYPNNNYDNVIVFFVYIYRVDKILRASSMIGERRLLFRNALKFVKIKNVDAMR